MDEDLDYISSSPLLGKDRATTEDETQLPTLRRVLQLLDEQASQYDSVSRSLALRDDKFTIEQQVAINQQVVMHLSELRTLVETAIIKVEETYSGR